MSNWGVAPVDVGVAVGVAVCVPPGVGVVVHPANNALARSTAIKAVATMRNFRVMIPLQIRLLGRHDEYFHLIKCFVKSGRFSN
jgi:hypothetical protein